MCRIGGDGAEENYGSDFDEATTDQGTRVDTDEEGANLEERKRGNKECRKAGR
jgi:hypothetical protein